MHNPGSDGQSKSGSPKLSRGRAVGLNKFLEQACLLLGADADSGIANGKVDLGTAAVRMGVFERDRFEAHSEFNFACIRELERMLSKLIRTCNTVDGSQKNG